MLDRSSLECVLVGALPLLVSFGLGTACETLAICAILALFHRPRDRNAKWAAIFDPTFALRAATLLATVGAWFVVVATTREIGTVVADDAGARRFESALVFGGSALYTWTGPQAATTAPDRFYATLLFPMSLCVRLVLWPTPINHLSDWLTALAHALMFAFVLRRAEFATFARRRHLRRWVQDDVGVDVGVNSPIAAWSHLPDLTDELTRSLSTDAGAIALPAALVQLVVAFAHEPLSIELADDWSHLSCAVAPRTSVDGASKTASGVRVAVDRLDVTRLRRPMYTLRDFERCAASLRSENTRRNDPVIQLAPCRRFVMRVPYSALAQVDSGRYAYLIDLRATCDPDTHPFAWAQLVRNLEHYSCMDHLLRGGVAYDIRRPACVHLVPVQVVDGVVARTWSDANFFGYSFARHARDHGTFVFVHGAWPIVGVRLTPHSGAAFISLGDLEMDPTHDYFHIGFQMTTPDADLRARVQAHSF